MNKDLTVGRPETVLWRFCLPLFGSVIFQQIYNIADSLIAGQYIGKDALAAVGNSYELTLIFIAFAFGCNIGSSVIVSKLFGAKRIKDMKTAIYTTLVAGGVLCVLLMAFGLLFGGTLLALIHTPDNIFADSRLYLYVYIFGLPFLFFYNISTGIFTALGDSKTPFYFLAASSLSNIGVDIFFVKQLRMGVAGVAWATFLCQGVSCILALWFVFRRIHSIKTAETQDPSQAEQKGREERPALFSWSLLGQIAVIAIPSILQQSFISVGNIIIQGVINSFGSGVIAGYSAAIKLNNLVITSFTTMGNGISNFTAQNLGAGKYERIRQGYKAGVKLVVTMAIPLAALYLVAGRPLIQLFLDVPDALTMKTGLQFLHIVVPFYFVAAMKLSSDGVLRGAGLMKQFMFSTFTDLILRVVLALVLSKSLGAVGIWMAWPIGWGISTCMSVFFALSYVRKKGAPSSKADKG